MANQTSVCHNPFPVGTFYKDILWRAVRDLPSLVSENWLGRFVSLCIFLAVFVGKVRAQPRWKTARNWQERLTAMRGHWGQNVKLVFMVVLFSYIGLFLISLVRADYQEHKEANDKISTLKDEADNLRNENATLKSQAQANQTSKGLTTGRASSVPVLKKAGDTPNGITIGRDNLGTATVNNFGPQLPNVSWSIEDNPSPPNAKHPEIWVRISIDRTFTDAKFAVICDRPCKAIQGQTLSPYGGYIQSSSGSIPNYPNLAAYVVNGPNPMPSDDQYLALVESEDADPVRIVDVKTLRLQKRVDTPR
ncbi:MAG TPA: hypothetical protein VG028_10220 [Terriglobia bacterium]|nr:hypothetical protein [Terriglobia bacterium]